MCYRVISLYSTNKKTAIGKILNLKVDTSHPRTSPSATVFLHRLVIKSHKYFI